MRALLSVANRQGLVGLARDLLALGVEVYATDEMGALPDASFASTSEGRSRVT